MSIQKPEYSYSNGLFKAGHVPPEALLRKMIAENRTVIAAGIRTNKAMEKEILFIREDKTPDQVYDFMRRFFDGTKAFTRLVSFHQMPSDFDEDAEIMPWAPLRDSKKNPLLFCAIDGDFPKYVDDSADHFSEAHQLMVDWLGPKIHTIFETAGNRPDKVFDYLRSDSFMDDFTEQFSHRGVLTFLPVTGEAFAIGKNELGIKSDWGLVSNCYGYTEAALEAATPVAEAKPVKSGASRYVTDDEPAPAKEVQPAAPTNPVTVPQAEPPKEMVEETKEISPPTGFQGKVLKNWYRQNNNGELPTNWRDHPKVTITVKKPVAKADEKKDKTSETAIGAAMKAAELNKNLTMPIVPGEKQKAFNDFIKKFVGDGSALISDPKATAEQESKLAKASELAGWKDGLAELNRFRTEFVFAMVREHPEFSALLMVEMRSELNRLAKLVGKLADGTVKMGELVGTETKETKPSTSTPEPATQQPAEPQKKVASGGASKYL